MGASQANHALRKENRKYSCFTGGSKYSRMMVQQNENRQEEKIYDPL